MRVDPVIHGDSGMDCRFTPCNARMGALSIMQSLCFAT